MSLHKNVVAHNNETVHHGVKDWEREPRLFPLGNFDSAMITTGSLSRFPMYDNDFGWGKPLAIRSGRANKFDDKISAFPGREGNRSAPISTKPSDPHRAPPNPVTHKGRSPPNPVTHADLHQTHHQSEQPRNPAIPTSSFKHRSQQKKKTRTQNMTWIATHQEK